MVMAKARIETTQSSRAFIVSANVHRRQLSKGQQAMAMAFAYPEPDKGGRGKNRTETLQFSKMRLSQARQILHHSKALAAPVCGSASCHGSWKR
jgi:hypothetical protein